MKNSADVPISEADLKDRLIQNNLWNEQIQTAFKIAVNSHDKQLTKDGSSYLTNHLFPVVNELLDNYDGNSLDTAVTIALLHDVLEDDPAMTVETLNSHLPRLVVESEEILTRQQESHGANVDNKLELSRQYMQKIMKSSYDVRIIKLADRMVNLSLVERLRESNPEKFNAYLNETKELFIPLAQLTSESYIKRLVEKLEEITNA